MKNIFFLILLFVTGSIYSQSWNPITGKASFTDSIRALKYIGANNADSVLSFHPTTGVLIKVLKGISLPPGVDSGTVSVITNEICFWRGGIATCYFLTPGTGGSADSLALNYDSLYILQYRNGTLIDSIFLLHTYLYVDDHFNLQTNYLGNPYAQLLTPTRLVDSTYIDGDSLRVKYGNGVNRSFFLSGGGVGVDSIGVSADSVYLLVYNHSGSVDSINFGGTTSSQNLQQVSDVGNSTTRILNIRGISLTGIGTGQENLRFNVDSSSNFIHNGYGAGLFFAPTTGNLALQTTVNTDVAGNPASYSTPQITLKPTGFINFGNYGGNFFPGIAAYGLAVASNGDVITIPSSGGIVSDTTFNWSVLDSLNTPPVSPTTGDIYEVGTVPTGAWVGHAGDIATWGGASWTFEDATIGDLLYNVANNLVSRFNGTIWVRVGKVAILQGSQALNAAMIIGTSDNNNLSFRTNGSQRLLLSNAGAVVFSGLSGTGNAIMQLTSTGQAARLAVLPIANGGTNNASLSVTAGTIYYGDGTKLVGLAPGTAAQHLTGGTTPSWKDTAVSSGGASWLLAGNAGITAVSNFFGTTDAKSLRIRTNNIERMRVDSVYGVFIDSTYFGRGAGGRFGWGSLAIGDSNLIRNTTGTENTALGDSVLIVNTTGDFNTFVGAQAGMKNTTGEFNSGVGYRTQFNGLSGTGYNSTIGYRSLFTNTTGVANNAIGGEALFSNTTANHNNALGYQALFANTTGAGNVAVGGNSLHNGTTGTNNEALGFEALGTGIVTGTDNFGGGRRSLYNLTSGQENTALGLRAMNSNTTGGYNFAVGTDALTSNLSGILNNAIGYQALFNITASDYNNAIGYEAGQYIADGITAATSSTHTLLFGYKARVNANGETNENVIGDNAFGLGSNTTVLGSANTVTTGIFGDLKLQNIGNTLFIKEGTNGAMGVVTLSGGTATVNTTKVTANSRIVLSVQSLGTVSLPTVVGVTARTAGTSFTITSASLTDTSLIAWVIIEPG